jgi:hypothetical protein
MVSADEVQVLRSIPFSSDAQISESVKQQCGIQVDIPRYIDAYSDQVALVEEPLPTSGRVLEITIMSAQSRGGGIYSGTKWVEVEGVLTENGNRIGNFSGRRATIGYFNIFGRCGPAKRCSKSLAKDISEWLEDPQLDSTLSSP